MTTNFFQCYDIALTTNGPTTITLCADDLAGNTFTTNFSLTVDYTSETSPPAVALIWPQDGEVIAGTNFSLRATVSDPTATVTVSITDTNANTQVIPAVVTRSGQVLAENISLGGGLNNLVVTATSAAGNSSVTSVSVGQNDVQLAIFALTSDQQNQPVVTVYGCIKNPNYSLTVNGIDAEVFADGSWEADSVAVSAWGAAIFNVQVYDNNGNPVGTQMFWQSQPVKVGTMTSLYHYADSSMDYADYQHLGIQAEVPPGGPPFGNESDTYVWNYLSGGADWGFELDSGGANWTISGANWPAYSDSWDSSLPAGEGSYCGRGVHSSFANGYEYDNIMIEPSGNQNIFGALALYVVQAQACKTAEIAPSTVQLDPASMTIRGQPLTLVTNSDGSIWGQALIVAPAGIPVDVTPKAAGNYVYYVTVRQPQPKIIANNFDLSTTKPIFCVGQHIVFKLAFDPELPVPYDTNKSIFHWHLPGKYVNESYPYSGSCTNYRNNPNLLDNIDTKCWYIRDPGGVCSIGMNLYFANGQSISTAAAGCFTIYRPTFSGFTTINPTYPASARSFLWNGDILSYGNAQTSEHGLYWSVDVNSKFDGRTAIVQLADLKYTDNYGFPLFRNTINTDSDYWLDGDSVNYEEDPYMSNMAFSHKIILTDQPAEKLWGFSPINVRMWGDFHDYLRFKPPGDDSIFITLAENGWSMIGMASTFNGLTINGTPAPSVPVDSDAFPVWIQVKHEK